MHRFYVSQSQFTTPGRYTYLYKGLPDSVADLCTVVHGLVAHRSDTDELYGFKLPAKRMLEADTRYVSKILAIILKLDSSPLTVERPPKKRFMGTCRDFAILLCSMLRHKGIPARLRCGFASYFEPGRWVDHWICEYWKGRWLRADAEIGMEERKAYGIKFDNTKLTAKSYLTSPEAWLACRKGRLNPDSCGVFSLGINGLWFVAVDVLRDLAALNKVEILPWDNNKYAETYSSELPTKEQRFIDQIARGNPTERYHNYPQLRITSPIISHTIRGLKHVLIPKKYLKSE